MPHQRRKRLAGPGVVTKRGKPLANTSTNRLEKDLIKLRKRAGQRFRRGIRRIRKNIF